MPPLVSAAFPSTPGAVLNCCLNLTPWTLSFRIWLGVPTDFSSRGFGQSRVATEDALHITSYQMPQRLSFEKPFRAVIPSKEMWSEGKKLFPPVEPEWFMGSSKTKSGTGARIVGPGFQREGKRSQAHTQTGFLGQFYLAGLGPATQVDERTTGAIMLCAFFVDIIVWYKAGSINFVDEQTTAQDEELNPMTGKSRSETSV
ncbi:hypothetical protein J6590_092193 [Homalodisca vitripennis]|nr:hypothetical protein J6590_092193 [Homalodisca vitripennis]